jgi:hypothetical protein
VLKLIEDSAVPFDDYRTLDRILGDAEFDPEVAELVELFHLGGTPDERLEAFYRSGTAQALAELMSRFGVEDQGVVCDLGCGTGWLRTRSSGAASPSSRRWTRANPRRLIFGPSRESGSR